MITTRAHLRETHECMSHSSPSKLLRAQRRQLLLLQRNSLVREQFAGVCFAEQRSTFPARRRPRKRVLLCVVNARHVFNSCFFCHRNLAAITLPLESDCSPFARISEKDIARYCIKTCHVLRWRSDTDAHLRKGFATEHAQELFPQRVPCQNAPSPVESLPAAPSCVGWAFHDRMKCHVISHQVHTCFVPFGVPHCVKLPSQSLISPT